MVRVFFNSGNPHWIYKLRAVLMCVFVKVLTGNLICELAITYYFGVQNNQETKPKHRLCTAEVEDVLPNVVFLF